VDAIVLNELPTKVNHEAILTSCLVLKDKLKLRNEYPNKNTSEKKL
jgi:hypothetical protein